MAGESGIRGEAANAGEAGADHPSVAARANPKTRRGDAGTLMIRICIYYTRSYLFEIIYATLVIFAHLSFSDQDYDVDQSG